MKTRSRLALLTALFGMFFGAMANAQVGGGFDLTWSSIDGGGGYSSGGGFELTGTIGQPDAGATMTGGAFSLDGGFQAAEIGLVPVELSGATIE